MANKDLQNEINTNFEASQEKLPQLMSCQPNRWTLMKGGEYVAFYDTLRDALTAGNAQFDDGIFSVQEITTQEVDLGWFSHAVH